MCSAGKNTMQCSNEHTLFFSSNLNRGIYFVEKFYFPPSRRKFYSPPFFMLFIAFFAIFPPFRLFPLFSPLGWGLFYKIYTLEFKLMNYFSSICNDLRKALHLQDNIRRRFYVCFFLKIKNFSVVYRHNIFENIKNINIRM